MLNVNHSYTYLIFFNAAMEFSLFPRTKRHVDAEAMSVSTRGDARKWIVT